MTADITIQSTPGQAAAIERDGFLVVAGPTEKPCPECGGDCQAGIDGGCGACQSCNPDWWIEHFGPCPTCNGDGTAPIVVEVVVPERVEPFDGHRRSSCCHGVGWALGYAFCGQCDLTGCAWNKNVGCTCARTIPARTILRGTAEAVPVVDRFDGLCSADSCLVSVAGGFLLIERNGEDRFTTDVTDHFADVPRPEVGDTAWIIRGEG